VCPGYKDEFDLVFRNETQATERRAQKANKKALAQKSGAQDASSASAADRAESSPDTALVSTTRRRAVIPALSVPVEQQAHLNFMANFVMVPGDGGTGGFLEYLVPLLNREGPNSIIQMAFDACSMALLNNRPNSRGKFRDRALAEYTKALVATNQALRDPEKQMADSTLASVLMLGMFEV
jgi:hypothetical protein